MIHTTYNTATSTYTIYNSTTTTKVPYVTNKTCYTIHYLCTNYTTYMYTTYITMQLQVLLTILQFA